MDPLEFPYKEARLTALSIGVKRLSHSALTVRLGRLSLAYACMFLHRRFATYQMQDEYRMPVSLLNFRQPRAVICLSLVAGLHILALLYLHVHARKHWPASSPKLRLPTISLQLLPLTLQIAATPVPAPPTRSKETAQQPTASPMAAINSAGDASSTSSEQLSSETSLESSAPPLNLNLSKRDLAAAAASKLPGPLPSSMTLGAWQQFVKALGPLEEIKEERLSINRVRIHTKYGCYELEQTATKRIDPLNWSPQLATNCRYG